MQQPTRLQTAARPSTSAPSDGSRTLTLDPTQHDDDDDAGADNVDGNRNRAGPSNAGVLRLRGSAMPGRGVQWKSDVVDNEFLGRKKSKICCIYHKPKAFDESSDESGSSSGGSDDDDSDGSADSRDERTQRAAGARRRRGGPRHHHHHQHGVDGPCEHSSTGDGGTAAGSGAPTPSTTRRNNHGSSTMVEQPGPKPEPNAYERNPNGRDGPSGAKGKGRA